MLRVRVYPDTLIAPTSKIYAGLFELEAAGQLQVKYTYKGPSSENIFRHGDEFTLWTEIGDDSAGVIVRICFDTWDHPIINSLKKLEQCDIYFKRSYDRQSLWKLPIELQKKIVPFGLNYACRSINERGFVQRHLVHYFAHKYFLYRPLRGLKKLVTQIGKTSVLRLAPSLSKNFTPPLIEEFEASPDSQAERIVLYQTVVYSPTTSKMSDIKQLKEMNDMRAEIIRALRKNFGERFIGGLAPTDFAKQHYADCITTNKIDKRSFMQLIKNSLITIVTTGLHNSTGWKLAEYLAASKCIVTEPLHYELPTPLEEEKNYLSFSSPEECVAACKKVLESPKLASDMRWNNYNYYKKEVEPAAHILSCIKRALSTKYS
jgi:hypothetical protein